MTVVLPALQAATKGLTAASKSCSGALQQSRAIGGTTRIFIGGADSETRFLQPHVPPSNSSRLPGSCSPHNQILASHGTAVRQQSMQLEKASRPGLSSNYNPSTGKATQQPKPINAMPCNIVFTFMLLALSVDQTAGRPDTHPSVRASGSTIQQTFYLLRLLPRLNTHL